MRRALLPLALVAAAVGGAVAQTAAPSSGMPSPGGSSSSPAMDANGNGAARGKTGISGSNGLTRPSAASAPDQPMSVAAMTARKAIERDGYSDVQRVAKGSDGLWHGEAMRGNTRVHVTVERSGEVSAR